MPSSSTLTYFELATINSPDSIGFNFIFVLFQTFQFQNQQDDLCTSKGKQETRVDKRDDHAQLEIWRQFSIPEREEVK